MCKSARMATRTATELPSGVVTFLFTDIEGSTRMLAILGDRYAEVLHRHNELLREVWPRNGGVEVNTEGDAFFVAFSSATDAVRAAADAQRTLAAEEWPRGMELRIRVGIHTGYARPRDGDYIALAVNQAARVVGTAHGGQVHLSQDAYEELDHDALEVEVASLGLHRVRDFDGTQVLYRVVADGWTDPGRPARARPAEGHNLHVPTTERVDRVDDLAWLSEHLAPGALVTLVGPGGVGKTRLAVEAGLEVVHRWGDGVWLVDLGAVGSPSLVPEAVVDAIGAPRIPGLTAAQEAAAHLEDREVLVVLDNCEHVLRAAVGMVDRLLGGCPKVGILATSRRPLGLRGEQVHRVEPLPSDSADADAVALFSRRAAGVGEDQLDDVVALCRELDGLPLAIELAAAHASTVAPAEILRRLRRTPAFLRTDDPGLPDRQRSLASLLDSSLDLLDERQRQVLRRVVDLRDGFDLDVAAVACADLSLSVDGLSDAVWALVEQSLLVVDPHAGHTRFRLPRTVRHHVASLPGGPASRVLALATHYDERLGPERAVGRDWISEMGRELDNVRGIVDRLDIAEPGQVVTAQRLAWSIARLHLLRSEELTGIEELRTHLDRFDAATPERVGLVTMLAELRLRTGDVESAAAVLDEAEALAARVGVPNWDLAAIPRQRGDVALRRGDIAEARRWGHRALAAATDARSRVRAWSIVGVAETLHGELEVAVDAMEQELAEAEAGGMTVYLAKSHNNLGEVLLQIGRERRAAWHQAQALDLARAQGETLIVAFSELVAARLLLVRGEDLSAVELHAAGLQGLAAAGYDLYEQDAEHVAHFEAEARSRLGDTYESVARAGRGMDFEQAADAAASALNDIAG